MTYRENKHGEKVSLLGYGMMRLPTVDGKHANGWAEGVSSQPIDQDEVNKEIDYALAHGLTYVDTSPAYCRGESERVTGIALARHDRSEFTIATKLSNFAPQFWSFEASKAMYENSFKELQVDHIDYYLLHSVGNSAKDLNGKDLDGFETFKRRYIDNGILDFLVEERKAGRIRNLGFSYHGDVRAFNWCMENHEKYHWDFCQIQMNYVDWHHAQQVNPRNQDGIWLYNELDKREIPIVIMEPLLGGRLARFDAALASKLKPIDPEASLASWALRFCGSFPRVMTILSGMTKFEHVVENVDTLSPLKPLNEHEFEVLEEAAKLYVGGKTIPCNDCQYCMPCPYGIDIPRNLLTWNRGVSHEYLDDKQAFLADYDKIPHLRRADHCIQCRRCVSHCPQSIHIPEELLRIEKHVAALRDAK